MDPEAANPFAVLPLIVFSQPGVPASPALWKAAACALFVVALGLPAALRAFAGSPGRGLSFIAGLLFAAFAAVGLGSLTAGGKLFSAFMVVLWYMAVSGVAATDFTGGISPAPTRSSLSPTSSSAPSSWPPPPSASG